MIGRIAGTLLEKNPPEVLVDVGGLGYEILVPMSTFYAGSRPSRRAAHAFRRA